MTRKEDLNLSTDTAGERVVSGKEDMAEGRVTAVRRGNITEVLNPDSLSQARTSTELEVDEIGPSMRYATAKINRNSRGGGNSYGGNQGFGGAQGGFNDNQGGGFGGNQGGGNPGGGNQGGGFNGNQGGRGGQQRPQQGGDPWGQSSGGNYDWGADSEDEPPF